MYFFLNIYFYKKKIRTFLFKTSIFRFKKSWKLDLQNEGMDLETPYLPIEMLTDFHTRYIV